MPCPRLNQYVIQSWLYVSLRSMLIVTDVDEFFHLPHIVRPGETISSVSLSRGAGGKGANQAYAVAKAGGNVVLAGHIGLDGLWVRELLQEGGVQVDKVEVLKDEVRTLLALIEPFVCAYDLQAEINRSPEEQSSNLQPMERTASVSYPAQTAL